jgi:hypothetical protein
LSTAASSSNTATWTGLDEAALAAEARHALEIATAHS